MELKVKITVAQMKPTIRTSVGVTVVHRGGIKTDIARNARFRSYLMPEKTHEDLNKMFDQKFVRTTADSAARRIISGIEKNKEGVLIGGDAKFMDGMARLFPVTATRFYSYLTHRYAAQI